MCWLVTYSINVFGAVISGRLYWDVLVFLKVDASVSGAEQLPTKHRRAEASRSASSMYHMAVQVIEQRRGGGS